VLALPGRTPIITVEGVSALDEAVRDLRATPQLPVLTHAAALRNAALDHVRDIGPKGITSHDGTDGSAPLDRISRYANGLSSVAEVISFGSDTGTSVVMNLLIDDGVRNRGHRHTLLDPAFRFAGTACGPHAKFRTVCVIDLAERLVERRTSSRPGVSERK
jgi:uncharacterized protein YkwD